MTEYRYYYDEATNMYFVETFNTEIDHWIMDQIPESWSYDYDDNPSYFTTKFVVTPELMLLLKLKWIM